MATYRLFAGRTLAAGVGQADDMATLIFHLLLDSARLALGVEGPPTTVPPHSHLPVSREGRTT